MDEVEISREIDIFMSEDGYGCEQEEEDTSHILLRCPMAVKVREWVFRWCGITQPHMHNIGDLIKFCSKWGTCIKRRKGFISICYGVAWLTWKARCDWVFKKIRIFPTKVADNIKGVVYNWIKHKRPNCAYRWIDWSTSSFICL
ncbi:hypothetical protein LXL04_038052 [Taraxacum kok-saghyz]